MRLNDKGFSLIEIMAVLAITTIILVPLLSGLSDSYNANQRAQHRSNALSVAQGSIYAIDKIDFSEYRRELNDSHGSLDYVELDKNQCDVFQDEINIGTCTNIFNQVWNSEQFDENTFKIYLIDYRLTQDQYNNITGSDIPQEVKDAIMDNTDITDNIGEANVETLIRVVIWIQYYENPDKAITLEGMLVDE